MDFCYVRVAYVDGARALSEIEIARGFLELDTLRTIYTSRVYGSIPSWEQFSVARWGCSREQPLLFVVPVKPVQRMTFGTQVSYLVPGILDDSDQGGLVLVGEAHVKFRQFWRVFR